MPDPQDENEALHRQRRAQIRADREALLEMTEDAINQKIVEHEQQKAAAKAEAQQILAELEPVQAEFQRLERRRRENKDQRGFIDECIKVCNQELLRRKHGRR